MHQKAPTVVRLRREIKQRENENSEERHFYPSFYLFPSVYFEVFGSLTQKIAPAAVDDIWGANSLNFASRQTRD
jgi:hypothetical protein